MTLAATASGSLANPPWEFAVDRHRDAFGDRTEMGQHLGQRRLVIRSPQGPGETGAGGGERGKAATGEQAGAPAVPGIGHYEAAGLVQPPERRASSRRPGHRVALLPDPGLPLRDLVQCPPGGDGGGFLCYDIGPRLGEVVTMFDEQPLRLFGSRAESEPAPTNRAAAFPEQEFSRPSHTLPAVAATGSGSLPGRV